MLVMLAVILLTVAGLFLLRERIPARVGIRLPTGAPGLATLTLPDGFVSQVFAEGLAGPRFMTVGSDGTLFVAERGANRIIALPDRDADGRADETIVVADLLTSENLMRVLR